MRDALLNEKPEMREGTTDTTNASNTVNRGKRNVVHCPGCWRTYPNIGCLIICDCGAEIEPKEGNQ